MTLEDTQNMIFFLLRYGFEAVVAGVVVFLLIKYFLPGYLTQKGKNLATTEDIERITEKIEGVKSQYSIILEEVKAKNQLRMAGIDMRLKAHQEAFSLWRELISHAHDKDIGNVVIKCQKWWENNCLYLEPEVRAAFMDSYSAAHTHSALLQGRVDAKMVHENWDRIIKAGQIILESVQLPGFSEIEKKEIAKLSGENNA